MAPLTIVEAVAAKTYKIFLLNFSKNFIDLPYIYFLHELTIWKNHCAGYSSDPTVSSSRVEKKLVAPINLHGGWSSMSP